MASYDDKLITAKAQKEILTVVKHAIDAVDVKATASIPKVNGATANNLPALTSEGALVDTGINTKDIQLRISPTVNGNFISSDENGMGKNSGFKPSDFQKIDALLSSLSAISNSEGILALNGAESAEARKIIDTDIKSTEALYHALRAFTNKNGSVVLPKDMAIINAETTKNILKHNGSAILIGDNSESVLINATMVDGKPQVFAGSVNPNTRFTTKAEMDSYVTDRLTKDSDYMGIITYVAVESTTAAAKGLIEALDTSKFMIGTPPTAMIFGDDDKKTMKGQFNGTGWTWKEVVFGNGDWVYFAHIINVKHPLQDAGRAVFKDTEDVTAFELLFDMTLVPDEVWTTVSSNDQKLTVKRTTIKNGTVEVPSAFGAWNLKVDDSNTIQDVLDTKITKLNIITNEPTSSATDQEVVSAKVIHTVLGMRDFLNTDVKDNHVAAINEVNSKAKTNNKDIVDIKAGKLDKIVDVETVDVGNIITIKDKAGNVQNSGIKVSKINEIDANKISKITTPTVGAIPTVTAIGSVANSATLLADVDQVIAEAIRVQDIITDADIAQLIKDVFTVK